MVFKYRPFRFASMLYLGGGLCFFSYKGRIMDKYFLNEFDNRLYALIEDLMLENLKGFNLSDDDEIMSAYDRLKDLLIQKL